MQQRSNFRNERKNEKVVMVFFSMLAVMLLMLAGFMITCRLRGKK
jgi:biopolymer transport protein ExbD